MDVLEDKRGEPYPPRPGRRPLAIRPRWDGWLGVFVVGRPVESFDEGANIARELNHSRAASPNAALAMNLEVCSFELR